MTPNTVTKARAETTLMPSRPILTRGTIAAAVALALAVGGGVAAQSAAPGSARAATPGAAAVVQPAMPGFADVAERVSPAVVNVTVVAESTPDRLPRSHPQLPEGAPMEEFFKHFFEQPGMPGGSGRPGSGAPRAPAPALSSIRRVWWSPTTMWWRVPPGSP